MSLNYELSSSNEKTNIYNLNIDGKLVELHISTEGKILKCEQAKRVELSTGISGRIEFG